jgi:hypothetical protein
MKRQKIAVTAVIEGVVLLQPYLLRRALVLLGLVERLEEEFDTPPSTP